jgi:hypothetical protein
LREGGSRADSVNGFVEQLWQTAFRLGAARERPTAEALILESLRARPFNDEWRQAVPTRFARAVVENVRDREVDETRVGNRSTPATTPRSTRDEARPRIDFDEGIHVNCAGIVLLHPFLPRLFEGVGIARDGKLLQPERAVWLLHYLATGQRIAPEYDLLVPKLLCNVPPETPVDARVELTAAEDEEAAALLAAVIGHWDALGDTSADGLRGTFLVRPGTLSRRDGDDLLRVEAQSFDVLLDRLPWSVGMIQLPWMEKLLWVEWRF